MDEIKTLGKYEIRRELGKGGFGTVYLARETVLSVERAIKVLHPNLLSDNSFISRFKQEAQISARLDHPSIVPVYEFGQIDGMNYLAMKYMAGGSLKDLLSQGKISVEKTQEYFESICQGVSFAHTYGVVHRDLKPSNMLIDEFGEMRVSDFGFAKAMASSSSVTMSSSGNMIGTPAYMAPEIWRGKPASPRSDIYSLGCILYEMLTGKVLFDGDSPAEVITRHVVDGPEYAPELPVEMRSVLDKALKRDPAQRYQSAKDMLADFKAVLRAEKIETTTPKPIIPNITEQAFQHRQWQYGQNPQASSSTFAKPEVRNIGVQGTRPTQVPITPNKTEQAFQHQQWQYGQNPQASSSTFTKPDLRNIGVQGARPAQVPIIPYKTEQAFQHQQWRYRQYPQASSPTFDKPEANISSEKTKAPAIIGLIVAIVGMVIWFVWSSGNQQKPYQPVATATSRPAAAIISQPVVTTTSQLAVIATSIPASTEIREPTKIPSTSTPKATEAPEVIQLKSCGIENTSPCILFYAGWSTSLTITLRQDKNFVGDYSMMINSSKYDCKISKDNQKRLLCTGKMQARNTGLPAELYSNSSNTLIAAGNIVIPRLAEPTPVPRTEPTAPPPTRYP